MRFIPVILFFLLNLVPASAGDDTRNVLLILVDDLNTALSCYGEDEIDTPHIDGLAAEGVRFDRAYCQYPSCGPSRVSLLTGLRPDRGRVYLNEISNRLGRPRAITLPQWFRQHGHFTARVGKVFHYGVPKDIGTDGLDDPISWDEVANPVGVDKEVEAQLVNRTPKRGLGWAVSSMEVPDEAGQHTDEKVTEETIRLMRESRDRPFFIAAGYFRPHPPLIAPERHFEAIPPESISLPEFDPSVLEDAPEPAFLIRPPNYGLAPKHLREFKRAYLASIRLIDEQVGQLLAAVEEFGLAEDTVVVLAGDQGFMLGLHGQWQKGQMFEDSLRVPLIIRDPAAAATGGVCAAPVELVDLYPTIATAAGLPTPRGLDGDNLLPLLDDPTLSGVTGPAFSMVQRINTEWVGRAVTTERWRYVRWTDGRAHQLYDLVNDPAESRNLADDPEHAATRAALAGLIDEQLRLYPPDREALEVQMKFPVDRERLRSLPVPERLR